MSGGAIILRYVFLINLFTFIIRGVDKWKASAKKWRISEKKLLRFTGLGGRVGAIIGMELFRHKTIKGKFLARFRLIATAWIILIIVILFSL